MEAQYGQVTVCQDAFLFLLYAKCVGRIVNHAQSIIVSNLLYRFDIARMAVAVDRHDGGGLRSDRRFDLGWVEIVSLRVNIDKYWFDAIPEQGMCSRHKRVRCRDDFAGDAQ